MFVTLYSFWNKLIICSLFRVAFKIGWTLILVIFLIFILLWLYFILLLKIKLFYLIAYFLYLFLLIFLVKFLLLMRLCLIELESRWSMRLSYWSCHLDRLGGLIERIKIEVEVWSFIRGFRAELIIVIIPLRLFIPIIWNRIFLLNCLAAHLNILCIGLKIKSLGLVIVRSIKPFISHFWMIVRLIFILKCICIIVKSIEFLFGKLLTTRSGWLYWLFVITKEVIEICILKELWVWIDNIGFFVCRIGKLKINLRIGRRCKVSFAVCVHTWGIWTVRIVGIGWRRIGTLSLVIKLEVKIYGLMTYSLIQLRSPGSRLIASEI